jgi:hypothetical protein
VLSSLAKTRTDPLWTTSPTARKCWRGNFLFVHDPSLGSSGFKHFRPIVREQNGALRRLTNAEIASNPQYGDLSPEPLDPAGAMEDAITSLEEQVKTRVTAVVARRPERFAIPNGTSVAH